MWGHSLKIVVEEFDFYFETHGITEEVDTGRLHNQVSIVILVMLASELRMDWKGESLDVGRPLQRLL